MNRITRRKFLKLAGIAGGASLLAGCAPAATPTAEPTKAAPVVPAATTASSTGCKFKKCKLTVASWWGPHEIAGAEKSFAGTFKQQTGIDVKYEFITNAEFNAKVLTNLSGSDPYDVVTYSADFVPAYIEKGILLPLDDLIKRDKFDLSNIQPAALEQWMYDGKLYGLTADMGSYHFYFNKEHFAKAGITPPKPTDEWTWDQLREWAKALTIKKGDQIVQYGFAGTGGQGAWDAYPNMNGAFMFSEGMKKALMDDPKVIEALTFYQNLIHQDGVALKPGSTPTSEQDMFLAGQISIMFGGTWRLGYYRSKKAEMKFDWDVALPPHNATAKEWFIPNFTAGWTIPKNAKDIDASWEAMKFYAGDTFAKEAMFTSLSGLPTTKTVLAGAWYAQWPQNPPPGLTKEFYSAVLQHGRAQRHLRYSLGPDITAAMKQLDLIYNGQEKPANLLPKMAADINKLLLERPWNKT